MESQDKTEKELIEENEELKRRIRELEGNLDLSGNSERQDIPARYLGLMLDNAQEAIVVHQDQMHRYVNRKAAEIYRYTVDEMKSKTIREVIHPDDYEKVIANYKRRVKGEQVEKYRYRGIDKYGGVKWLEIVGTSIIWEGRPGSIVFVTDVTAQVEAEEEIKRSGRILNDIINFLPDATYATDCDGRVIAWNREMEKLSGIKAADMIGKGDFEYSMPFYGERRPTLIDLMKQPDSSVERTYPYFAREGRFLYAENCFTIRGEPRWFWFKVSRIYDHNNEVVGFIETVREVTGIKTAESELKMKSRNLEEANIALKVLLKHREDDKSEIEDAIIDNIKQLIVPYMEKLRMSGLNSRQSTYMEILETHIEEIVSPFLNKMTGRHANLTPREVQIAGLVKDGKTSKEIAEILGIAENTVTNYRKRLRKKFALRSKDKNLRTHLLSFQ